MKIIASIVFFLILSCPSARAQEKAGVPLSEIRKNKNQLELDIKNIFNGLHSASLIYKRQFRTGDLIEVNAMKMWRIHGRINSQIDFSGPPTHFSDTVEIQVNSADGHNLRLGIGFEKQKFHNGFVHYYGVDLIGEYDFYSTTLFRRDIDGVGTEQEEEIRTSDVERRTIEAGINPFFGVKYYITNRLSLGLETGISVNYFNSKEERVSTITEIDSNTGTVLKQIFTEDIRNPVASYGIRTAFNNLRFLTVGYSF